MLVLLVAAMCSTIPVVADTLPTDISLHNTTIIDDFDDPNTGYDPNIWRAITTEDGTMRSILGSLVMRSSDSGGHILQSKHHFTSNVTVDLNIYIAPIMYTGGISIGWFDDFFMQSRDTYSLPLHEATDGITFTTYDQFSGSPRFVVDMMKEGAFMEQCAFDFDFDFAYHRLTMSWLEDDVIIAIDGVEQCNLGYSFTIPDSYHHFYIMTHAGSENQLEISDITITGTMTPSARPYVKMPHGMLIQENTTHGLEWYTEDDNPKNYSIYFDGVMQVQGIWNGGNINLEIPPMTKGRYQYTLELFDEDEQQHIQHFSLLVVDENYFSDFTYEEDFSDLDNWLLEAYGDYAIVLHDELLDMRFGYWGGSAIATYDLAIYPNSIIQFNTSTVDPGAGGGFGFGWSDVNFDGVGDDFSPFITDHASSFVLLKL